MNDARENTDDAIVRAVGGDGVALESLLVLHAEAVLSYVRRQMPNAVGSSYEAEDVMQDVCAEACRRIGEFRSRSVEAFLPWLLTIARHRLVALLRSVKSQKRGGGREPVLSAGERGDLGDVIEVLESLAVFYRTPSISAMSHEAVAAVQQSINRLTPDHRIAIHLRHIEGMAAKEAAAMMNRTEGAFHLLCNRGLKTLREDLRSKSYFV